jgi:glycosyltransferase involved in cell wall biosynthesis
MLGGLFRLKAQRGKWMTNAQTMTRFPLVTVVIPCRNEAAYIRQCLDSLLANEYPQDKLEILIVDGMSEDGTREIVAEYARRYPFARLLDNPKQITPIAMNIGVRSAKGEILAILGAHSTYDRAYLSECVRHLQIYDADQVGASAECVPRENTLVGRGIALALHHPFGAGANIGYKVGVEQPTWVDTVSSGCYRRDVFARVGFFNEELLHSQDIEFNRRIRRAGGKILLIPTAVIHYYCRSDIPSFCEHNFRNGIWAIMPFLYSKIMPVSWRHLVPLGLVTTLLGSGLLAFWHPAFLFVFLLTAAVYLLVNLLSSCQVAWEERDPRYLLIMPMVFGSLHFAYGFGSLWGFAKATLTPRFWKRLFRDPVESPRTLTGITPSGSSACEQPTNRE